MSTKSNVFGTFTDRDGKERQCRLVGLYEDPVVHEEFKDLIFIDYCLDDGTPVRNAVIHKGDFRPQ